MFEYNGGVTPLPADTAAENAVRDQKRYHIKLTTKNNKHGRKENESDQADRCACS